MGNSRYINGLTITQGERPDEWIVSRNGNDHIIYCEKGKKLKDCNLFVDNEEVELPSDFITKYIAIDYPIQIEGKVIRCVCVKELPKGELVGAEPVFNLAIRGEYVTKNERYFNEQKNLLVALAMILINGPAVFLAVGWDLIPPGMLFAIMLISATSANVYLEYLHIREKKGEYNIISEVQRQIKRYKRRIWTMHILAIISTIAMIAAITVMNIEMPIIIWILVWLWFIGGGRYVVHLWKKVRELEREI